jgi:hypothetical protein
VDVDRIGEVETGATSLWIPGYRFQYQVPPTSPAARVLKIFRPDAGPVRIGMVLLSEVGTLYPGSLSGGNNTELER